jgi:hypothetical protein
MTEHVLSTRDLNRALLARQLLLERSSLPITRAMERVAGLQTQYSPSGYVALWSRLRDFRREALTTALERRWAVQATLMRATIHMVSARDHALFAAGVRQARRDWWLRTNRRQIEGVDMGAVAKRLRTYLADGPRRRSELIALLSADGFPALTWSGAGLWVDLVRVPPSGTWERRRADLFGLADRWLGPATVTEAQGLEFLVRRYLGGFGPASINHVASWAGLSVTAIRPAVEGLGLRRFRDEQGTELLDVPGGPLPGGDVPAPVRFLPTWEAMLLVHARRTQVLPERFRSVIFTTKNPHSESTFLVDGAVAGTWRYEDGCVRIQPFEVLPRRARRDLDDEAERLAAFHAD